MANEVDSRVVELKFENKQFEEAVSKSLATLNNLKEALNFKKMDTSSLEKVQKTVNDMDFSHIEKSLDSLESRFSTFGIVGMTAIQKLTSSVMDMGMKIAGAIPNQMIQGALNRAGGIKQAQFQLKGLGINWDDIKDDIDYGVKDTAYSLDAAAKAASMLSASGIRVGDSMKRSLRGISGVAAMTNQSYEMISDIFTTVAGQGVLMGSELTRLGYYGLNAAATLKDYLRQNAEQYQYLFDNNRYGYKSMAEATEEDIRDLASQRAITYEMFAAAMDSAYGQHAKDANEMFQGALANVKAALARTFVDVADAGFDAATKVLNAFRVVINSVNPLLKPINEMLITTMNSFADFWESVFNGFNETIKSGGLDGFMKEINSIIEYILMAIGRVADDLRMAVSPLLRIFGTLVNNFIFPLIHAIEIPAWGAIRAFIQAVGSALENVILPAISGIAQAFQDTGLFNAIGMIIERIANVFSALEAGFKEFGKSDAFAGIFYGAITIMASSFELLLSAIEVVITAIRDFIAYTAPISAAIFNIFGAVGRFIGSIVNSIKKTNIIKTVYESIIKLVSPLANILQTAVVALLNFVAAIINGATNLGVFQAIIGVVSSIFVFLVSAVETVVNVLYDFYQAVKQTIEESGILQTVLEGIKSAFGILYGVIKKVADIIVPIIKDIGNHIADIFVPMKDSETRVGRFKTLIVNAVDKVQNAFKKAKSIIVPIFQDIARVAKPIIDNLVSKIAPVVLPIFDKLKDGTSSFVRSLEEISKADKPFERLVEFLNPFKELDFSKIGADFSGFITGTIPDILAKGIAKITGMDFIGSIFGGKATSSANAISVGDKVGEEVATNIGEGFRSGIEKGTQNVNIPSLFLNTLNDQILSGLEGIKPFVFDALKNLGDITHNAISYLFEKFTDVAPKIKWIVDVFLEVQCARLFGALRKLAKSGDPLGLAKAIEKTFEPLKILALGFRDIGKGIKRVLTGGMVLEMAGALLMIVQAIKGIQDAMKDVNFWPAVITVAGILAFVAALAVVLDKLIEVKKTTEEIAGLPKGLSTLLNGIKDALSDISKGVKIAGIGLGVAALAGAVWLVVEAVKAAEGLDYGHLDRFLPALLTVLGIIGVLSYVMGALSELGGKIAAAGAGIFLAAAAIKIIVDVIDQLQAMQHKIRVLGRGDDLIAGLKTVGVIMGAIAGALTAMSLLGGLSSFGSLSFNPADIARIGASILLVAFSFKVITEALSNLASIEDMGKLVTAGEVLKNLFMTLTGMMAALSLAVGGFKFAVADLGGALLGAFAPAQKLLGDGGGITKLGDLFKGKAGGFQKFAAQIMDIAFAILVASLAFLVLAGALWLMKDIPADQMQASTEALVRLFVILSVALGILSAVAKKTGADLITTATALVIAAAAMAILAGSLWIVGQSGLDSNGMIAAAEALAIMFGMLGVVMVSLAMYAKMAGEEMLLAAASLVVASVAFIALAAALYIVAQATKEGGDLVASVVALSVLFVVMTAAIAVLAAVAQGAPLVLLAASAALAIAGAAMIALSVAVLIISQAIDTLVDALGKLNGLNLDFGSLIAKLGLMLTVFTLMSGSAMTAAISNIFGGPGALKTFAETIDKFADAMKKLNELDTNMSNIDAALDKIVNVIERMSAIKVDWSMMFGGADALAKFAPAIESMANAFKMIEELSLDAEALDEPINKITEVFNKLAGAADGLGTETYSEHNNGFLGIGKTDIESFNGGKAENLQRLADSLKPIADAMQQLADMDIDSSGKYETNLAAMKTFIDQMGTWADGFGEFTGEHGLIGEGIKRIAELAPGIKAIGDTLVQITSSAMSVGDPDAFGNYIGKVSDFIHTIQVHAAGFASIGDADGSAVASMRSAFESIGPLADGLRSLSEIFKGTDSVEALNSGDLENITNSMDQIFNIFNEDRLKRFGEEGATTAVNNMQQIPNMIQQMMSPFQQLSQMDFDAGGIEGKVNTFGTFVDKAMAPLDKLVSKTEQDGRKYKTKNVDVGAFKNITEGIGDLVWSFAEIGKMPDVDENKVTAITDSLTKLVEKFGEVAKTTSAKAGGQVNADTFKAIADGTRSLIETMQLISTLDFKGGDEGGGLDEKLASITGFVEGLAAIAPQLETAMNSFATLQYALAGEENGTQGLVTSLQQLGTALGSAGGDGGDGASGIVAGIQQMMEKFDELKGKLPEVASAITDADLSGKMTEAMGKMIEAISNSNDSMCNAMWNVLGNVQATIGMKAGDFYGAGHFEVGWKVIDGINAVEPNLEPIIGKIKSAFESEGNGWSGVGANIAEGVAGGISGSSAISNAARDAVRAAVTAAKDEAGIKSPARVFIPIGRYMAAGMAVGIQNGTYFATDAIREAVQDTAAAFTLAAQHETFAMDMSPSITPVISMSDVQADANSLSAMLSPQSLTPRLSTNLGLEAVTEQNVSLQNDAVVNEVSKLRGEVQTYTEAVLTHIGSTYIDGISVNDNDAIHDTFIEMLYDLKRRAAMNGGR